LGGESVLGVIVGNIDEAFTQKGGSGDREDPALLASMPEEK